MAKTSRPGGIRTCTTAHVSGVWQKPRTGGSGDTHCRLLQLGQVWFKVMLSLADRVLSIPQALSLRVASVNLDFVTTKAASQKKQKTKQWSIESRKRRRERKRE